MKWFLNPCQRHRQALCLLAGGVPPQPEVARHLATCANCRAYFEEIQSVTTTLANWAANLPRLQPSPAAQARWARAIQTAGRPEPRPVTPVMALSDWWHDVIWRSRRAWAGLAAVWIVILAGHLSLGDRPPPRAPSAPVSQAMIMALRDRENFLAELLADYSTPRDADRPKFFLPKPRTQNQNVFTA